MVRKIKNLSHFVRAILAVILYRFPAGNLQVIGVTGTDGKTTTVHLIGAILRQAGFRVATISTLGAYLGEEKVEIGLHVTTPDPSRLQKLLRKIADQGFTHVVLEATSHGLDQHRLLGCNFKVGVLTNVTQEHLDYHGTYESYLKAKARLFRRVRLAVLNKDDRSFGFLRVKCEAGSVKIVTYGLKSGDITLQTFPFKTKLPGEHNLYNCLAAAAAARGLGVKDEVVKKAIGEFSGLPGRLEEIDEGQPFRVFVDFAHTPGAFEKVLPTVKKMVKGEVIHVFGCTGDRDKSKRSVMGEASAKLADKIILTHEDTYLEDPQKIMASIEEGVKKEGKILNRTYWKIFDRKEAINTAIRMAEKDDVVLLTGVGHQTTLNLGGQEVPWSDQEIARQAIKEK